MQLDAGCGNISMLDVRTCEQYRLWDCQSAFDANSDRDDRL